MTDLEISNYLAKHNYKVEPQNFLIDVLNTSPQIIDEKYDFGTRIMTLITPQNTFSFEWNY